MKIECNSRPYQPNRYAAGRRVSMVRWAELQLSRYNRWSCGSAACWCNASTADRRNSSVRQPPPPACRRKRTRIRLGRTEPVCRWSDPGPKLLAGPKNNNYKCQPDKWMWNQLSRKSLTRRVREFSESCQLLGDATQTQGSKHMRILYFGLVNDNKLPVISLLC